MASIVALLLLSVAAVPARVKVVVASFMQPWAGAISGDGWLLQTLQRGS